MFKILGAGSRMLGLPGASLTGSSMGFTGLILTVVGFFLLLTFLEALIKKSV